MHWDVSDPESWREGASRLRAVVHEGDHGVDGYALWRVRNGWDEAGPAGEVRVVEQVSTTPEAYTAIWRFQTVDSRVDLDNERLLGPRRNDQCVDGEIVVPNLRVSYWKAFQERPFVRATVVRVRLNLVRQIPENLARHRIVEHHFGFAGRSAAGSHHNQQRPEQSLRKGHLSPSVQNTGWRPCPL